MATHYKDHLVRAFVKITAVFPGNLMKHMNTLWIKFRDFKSKTSCTIRIETGLF